MTNIIEISKSPNFIFRRAIFDLMDSLSLSLDPEDYITYLERLDAAFESFPNNNISDSIKFFDLVSSIIFEKLHTYYEISSKQLSRSNTHKTIYTFVLRPEQQEVQDTIIKYRNKSRFLSAFLPGFDDAFYRYFRNLRQESFLVRNGTVNSDLSLDYVPYRFNTNEDVFLPVDSTGSLIGTTYRQDSFSQLFKTVNLDYKFYETMNERYDYLLMAISVFEEELIELTTQGYRQLSDSTLAQLLPELIYPIESIVNEEIVQACASESRKLFVFSPSLERLVPIGTSVYVYAAHDLTDDSSYVIKPIVYTDESPSDTAELKFLGIGQLSGYDTTSLRSRGGENPYVINGNIYAKASWQDFETLFPDELVSHMKSCQRILQSLGLEEQDVTVHKTEQHKQTLQKLSDFNLSGREIIIGTYLVAMSSNDIKEHYLEENDREKQEPFVFKMKKKDSLSENVSKSLVTNISYVDNSIYSFSLADTASFNLQLFRRKAPHYEPIAIFYDYEDSAFYAARLNQASAVEIHKTTSGENACRALSLSTGVYTVYAYGRRGHHPSLAMYSVYSHQEQPEVLT